MDLNVNGKLIHHWTNPSLIESAGPHFQQGAAKSVVPFRGKTQLTHNLPRTQGLTRNETDPFTS
jgi:hypothetical protein